jgi:uncharacterized protein
MARLAYYAPGVYVEEIPSARQPIAGVGTNTVGFIGLVPDTIHIPEPNSDYDPVLAHSLLNYQRLIGSSQNAEEERLRLQAALRSLEGQVAEAERNRQAADQRFQEAKTDEGEKDAAVKGLGTAASEEDTARANRALTRANALRVRRQTELDDATAAHEAISRERDGLKSQLDAAPAPPAPPAAAAAAPAGPAATKNAETEDDYEDSPPESNSDLLGPSKFRPYHLRPFRVQAEELATKLCTNFTEYAERFGRFSAFKATPENPDDDPSLWRFKPLYPGHHQLTHAVDGFFRNGGTRCFVARIKRPDQLQDVLDRFESIEEVAIIAAPGLPKEPGVWSPLEDYCEDDAHQNVFAILDSPAVVNDSENNLDIERLQYEDSDPLLPRRSTHAAYYFPHIEVVDPAKLLQDSDPARYVASKYRGRTYVAPSGHVAGIYARTDEERGVHKAPANATVRGALEVKYYISKPKQELLNPQGVNCIRLMNGDVTVWGARTVGGAKNGEWMYVNVRRFAGFLEESIMQGTQWVVFEPNDPNLWSRIILNITAFLTNVWRSGALFGLTPEEAFYVKCDAELNPPEVRDLGQVITEIGVAIVRPAEFVIFRITQSTGPRQG